MTSLAVKALDAFNVWYVLHTYPVSELSDIANHAATQLGLDPATVLKTLVIQSDAGDLYVALVPASSELDMKALARLTGSKKVRLADQALAERVTGYARGAMSPFGQRSALPVYIDKSVLQYDRLFVSGGRRGVEIEIKSQDLIEVCQARVEHICRQ